MKRGLGLKQAIDEYRDVFLAYRNFAPRTREEYVNDLEDLARFLERMEIFKVEKVQLSHLVRYMAELDKRGYAGSTRKRKTISIKTFFKFLYIDGHIVQDISKQLVIPIVEERKPRFLSKDEYTHLLESAKSNKRDYAIIQIFLHTGIKLSELTRLTLDDIQEIGEGDNKGERLRYIRVVGNHQTKGREIPINKVVSSAIDYYLSEREGVKSNFLFLNRKSKQLGERGVEKALDKYLKASGILNASVNSLRHTFGMYQAVRGIDKKTIQKVMGHKDQHSTSFYLVLAKDVTMRE